MHATDCDNVEIMIPAKIRIVFFSVLHSMMGISCVKRFKINVIATGQ